MSAAGERPVVQFKVPNRQGVLGVWMSLGGYGRLVDTLRRARDGEWATVNALDEMVALLEASRDE